MLSSNQTALIKATVPLLESGGETLIRHFYQLMFNEYPEVRPLFNQANQVSGEQPRALANSVLAYARHIDELEKLGPLLGQIINKHVALQILPEHYPIVGSCLLRAIREVLGKEVATDEVIDAWKAAYEQLANILIGAEEQAYAANEQREGGWRGGRTFSVIAKVPESEEITSFHLAPVDGAAILTHAAGQYIGLRLMINGEEVRRNYSLSDSSNGRYYRISVKREAKGKASNYLHDQVQVGTTLELFPPAGNFVLQESSKPLVLISAGVGITPSLPMLEQASQSGRPIHFIHCARHGGVHAFREWVDAQAEQQPHIHRYYCYSEPRKEDKTDATGFISRELLERWLPAERDLDAYFIGPKPFMVQVKKQLRELGVPEQQTHYEFFGPASGLGG